MNINMHHTSHFPPLSVFICEKFHIFNKGTFFLYLGFGKRNGVVKMQKVKVNLEKLGNYVLHKKMQQLPSVGKVGNNRALLDFLRDKEGEP